MYWVFNDSDKGEATLSSGSFTLLRFLHAFAADS